MSTQSTALRLVDDEDAQTQPDTSGGMSLGEVGKILGMSRQRVQQIEREAIGKIQRLLRIGNRDALAFAESLRAHVDAQRARQTHWQQAEAISPGSFETRSWLDIQPKERKARRRPSTRTIPLQTWTVDGVCMTAAEVAKKYGLDTETARTRLKRGVDLSLPVMTPKEAAARAKKAVTP